MIKRGITPIRIGDVLPCLPFIGLLLPPFFDGFRNSKEYATGADADPGRSVNQQVYSSQVVSSARIPLATTLERIPDRVERTLK
jgi:hypothetical protein